MNLSANSPSRHPLLKFRLFFFTFILIFVSGLTIYFLSGRTLSNNSLEIKVQDMGHAAIEIKNSLAPLPTKIVNGIPDRFQIETAFVPQAPEKNWQQPWQDACEEAALLTVDYYYKGIKNPSPEVVKSDLLAIFDYESKQGWGHDINQSQMAQVGQNFLKLNSQIIDNPSVDALKTLVSQNKPVIATANGKMLFKENKRFKNGGPWYHAVIILGFDSGLKQFIVHDVGTQFGSYFRYSENTLLSAIHDLPDNGQKENIASGPLRVLVLLK